jgi:hypothetical protein
MPIILNGINGITTPVLDSTGDVTIPDKIIHAGDTNTSIRFPAADTVTVETNGSERLRVDSSGNVGIGVVPSAWNSVYKAIQIAGGGTALSGRTDLASNSQLLTNAFRAATAGSPFIYVNTGEAARYDHDAGEHVWLTAPSGTAGNTVSFSERMRINSSGNLLVGTTAAPNGTSIYGSGFVGEDGSRSVLRLATSSTNQLSLLRFYNPNGQVGEIKTQTTSTLYVTSSDYRLKENVQPIQDALTKIAQLNPVTYTWKADGSAGQGFIAHELQAVVPDCVTGEKDAVNAEGNPQYQGVDTSFLVATLVKAIQEQQAVITALKASITALEAK